MFEEIRCWILGHELEPVEEREDGHLPKFECERCGRKIEGF